MTASGRGVRVPWRRTATNGLLAERVEAENAAPLGHSQRAHRIE